jgi:hypothetical protein
MGLMVGCTSLLKALLLNLSNLVAGELSTSKRWVKRILLRCFIEAKEGERSAAA